MKILFIGDIVGRIGRETVKKLLPRLIHKHSLDFVFANAENSAHGSGITETIVEELRGAGIDYFTTGDHAFKNKKQLAIFDNLPVLRPANTNNAVPGKGQVILEKNGAKILLINLIGQVFMPLQPENPFIKLDEILADNHLPKNSRSAIIVDIHAETTSEKIALAHYADGRASAIIGTHTHVQTADARISAKGMAAITDVGMVGSADNCLGVEKDGILRTFLTQVKEPHVIPEKGQAIFNAVLIKFNNSEGQATAIKPISEFIEIN